MNYSHLFLRKSCDHFVSSTAFQSQWLYMTRIHVVVLALLRNIHVLDVTITRHSSVSPRIGLWLQSCFVLRERHSVRFWGDSYCISFHHDFHSRMKLSHSIKDMSVQIKFDFHDREWNRSTVTAILISQKSGVLQSNANPMAWWHPNSTTISFDFRKNYDR